MTGIALLYFCHIFTVYILFVYGLYLCEDFAWNTGILTAQPDNTVIQAAAILKNIQKYSCFFCGEHEIWWKGLKHNLPFTEPPLQLPAGIKEQLYLMESQEVHECTANSVHPQTVTTSLFCEVLCWYPMLLYPIKSLVSASPSWRSWHQEVLTTSFSLLPAHSRAHKPVGLGLPKVPWGMWLHSSQGPMVSVTAHIRSVKTKLLCCPAT